MPLLRHKPYYNTPNTRKISAADFKSVGLENQSQVVWEPSNGHTAEVPQEVVDKLQQLEPRDWAVVESSGEVTIADSGLVAETAEESEETSGTGRRTNRRSQ